MNHITISTIITFLVLFITTSPSLSEIVDQVVAVVNNEAITFSMVEDEISLAQLKSLSASEEISKSPSEVIQKLIDHKLKLQEARRLGIIVSEEELARAVGIIASRFPSQKEFTRTLEQRGITQQDLEVSLMEDIMIQKMIDRKFLLFLQDSKIEGEALELYQQNKEKYIMSEQVLLDEIFFKFDLSADEKTKAKLKEEAEAVLNRLKNGEDFAKYSTAGNGYKPVNRLIPIIAETVSQLKIGEISDLVETPVGYFIIKLEDRRSARQAIFDEVKEKIKEDIRQQKVKTELETWLKRQRNTADIRIKLK